MWTQQSLQDLVQSKLQGYRFIVVANREPYIHRYAEDRIEWMRPASGMATALDPIMEACGGVWVAHGSGDADRATVDEHDHVEVPPDKPKYTLRRVWLTKEQEDGYYYGMSNEGLWPLCHIVFTRPTFNPSDWQCYREVNQLFADAVLQEAGNEPTFVFIQDYHFGLLPRMLKEKNPNLIVAHFWHIPWPNREAFRAYPWKEELLDGLLGNDLLGFHIHYHCQNFLDTVDRAIESKVDYECYEITRGGKVTTVRPFPISIDFADHEVSAAGPVVEMQMKRWRHLLRLKDEFVGCGIERLDYTKGIPDRLRALDYLLERRPEYRGQLVFVQIAVPSRTHIQSYQNLDDEVDRLVEQINWKWSSGTWKPVRLLKEHKSSEEMMALHRLSHFCIVSSLHDGMNLVAKEYVASRFDEEGALILSHFTGSARELTDALLVNPFAVEELADAVHRALTMPPEERQRRMKRMREQVAYNNVYRWAGKVLSTLLKFDFPEGA
jgi:trehalose 6-phosphate synthase